MITRERSKINSTYRGSVVGDLPNGNVSLSLNVLLESGSKLIQSPLDTLTQLVHTAEVLKINFTIFHLLDDYFPSS